MKPSFRLVATIPADNCEQAIALCHAIGMLGCEEQDVPSGVILRVYFKDQDTAQAVARRLEVATSAEHLSVEKVEAEDWNAKWRESMKPARLARGYWVSPLWLPPPSSARHWIKIEPKMAFGTGHHETTRLAAAMLIANQRRLKDKRLLDIGSGSGVLCFTAEICGVHSCLGVEIDPDCTENLAENRDQNRDAGKPSFLIGTIDCLKAPGYFDVAIMNMLITESAPLMGTFMNLLTPNSILIWSGILVDERDDALSLAQKAGLEIIAEKQEHEWWCGAFRKT